MKSFFVCLALLLGASTSASPQEFTSHDVDFRESGNDFLRICDAANPVAVVKGMCIGYVNGVIDGITLTYEVSAALSKSAAPVKTFCFRPDVTWGQKLRVVTQFIKTHPEKGDLPTNELIFHATLDAFPCPRTEPQPPHK